MKTQPQAQALHIVGIELRTTNLEANATIPAHWQRFTEESVLSRIPERLSDEVFAVYTNFEDAGRSNEGLYSLVIGARVPAQANPPDGLVRAVVPASLRAVFPVETGRFDLVGAAWHEIWQRHELRKTFLAEYEHYAANGTIEISVGIAAPAGAAP